MSEFTEAIKVIQEIADAIGYTGALFALFLYAIIRNQGKLVEAQRESNRLTAQLRSEENKQESRVLDKVLNRQTSILDEMKSVLSELVPTIKSNSKNVDNILDEIRTHESAALARHEKVHVEHENTRQTVTDSAKEIKDAHKETRLTINPIATNVHSMVNNLQGVHTSMANMSDKMERRLKAIEDQLSDIKTLLGQLPSCNNQTDIKNAVETITGKLDKIETLVKEKENGTPESDLEQRQPEVPDAK